VAALRAAVRAVELASPPDSTVLADARTRLDSLLVAGW